jgi:hypothetical protein
MKNLYKALLLATKEMGPCPMTGMGNYGPYSTLEDVIAHTKANLAQHGLFITQFYKPGLILVTRLVHAESGEHLDSECNLILESNTPQKLGSATTYTRRFSDLALLGLASDGDPDSATGHAPRTSPGASSSKGTASKKGVGHWKVANNWHWKDLTYNQVDPDDLDDWAAKLRKKTDRNKYEEKFLSELALFRMEEGCQDEPDSRFVERKPDDLAERFGN